MNMAMGNFKTGDYEADSFAFECILEATRNLVGS